jgi:exopolyphosphatase/guanosine-5'-triphosphate,3'-diphosphate pyrophosphatase
MKNRIAIVDLGTNTFHLLIAEKTKEGYSVIFRERQAVKIGKGGINRNRITEEAVCRAIETMRSFRQTIDAQQVSTIKAIGTSALRNAANQQEVLSKIKSETGIAVRIISGEEEAQYIYYGVRWALNLGSENVLIMDIGGGSVEFIIANGKEIFWKASFEIGAQRLLEKFQHHDPIKPEETEALDRYFDEQLPALRHALYHYQPRVLAGSSGTFDTLSDIYCERHHITPAPHAAETPLTLEAFHQLYDELIRKNRQQRLAIPGMIEMRVDMIVVACCLIRYVLTIHSFARIRVSSYSLKEGVLSTLQQS